MEGPSHIDGRGRHLGVFRHPHFRRLWIAGAVSNAGTWLHTTVAAVAVYQESQSPILVALVSFATLIPQLVLAIPAGNLADRLDRRVLILWTNLASAVFVGLLAVLAIGGVASSPVILVVTLLAGVAYALAKPALAAVYPSLVPPEEVTRAAAGNSLQFVVGSTTGPIIALWLLAVAPPWVAFAVNALSSLVPCAVAVRLPPEAAGAVGRGARPDHGALSGLRFVIREPGLGVALAGLGAVAVIPESIRSMSPVVAVQVLEMPETAAGLVLLVTSLGTASGLLLVARSSFPWLLDRPLVTSLGCQLLGSALVVITGTSALQVVGLYLVGIGQGIGLAVLTGRVQSWSPDAMRGRVMSLHALANLGSRPVVALLVGGLTSAVGAGLAIGAAAAAVAIPAGLIGGIWLLRERGPR